MTHRSISTLFALAFMLGTARADTITIGASKDNTLYGNSGTLSNGKGSGCFSGVTGNGGLRRALIQFTVAGSIPAGSTVTSVQLTLQLINSHAPAEVIDLHRVLESWGEGTSVASFGGGGGGAATTNDATWTHRFYPATTWTTVGGSFSPTVSASQTINGFGAYVWGSTPALVADVQSFLDTPSGNNGWLLQCTDEVSAPTAKKFGTREETNGLYRPKLTIVYTPPSPFTAFCFGDGTGTACPCGNAGTAGNGCASSSHPSGANLAASGNPSLAADTLVIQGSSMSSVGGVLYFQGSAPMAGGLGIPFGDGLLCAGGSIQRLGVKFNVGGASQFPDVGDPTISVQGLVTTPGSVHHYQGWYRDAAVFCNAETYNLTNAVSVVWAP